MSSPNPDTRKRILQATADLLSEGSGTGVRMSDIAKRAGISRQAVYLHFANRADLLIGATFYVDELKDSDARLAPSRAAKTGRERLDAFIEAWSGYLPEIYPIGRALIDMSPTDEEARRAWAQRMQDMREGCEAAINALKRDGDLAPGMPAPQATDLLWTLLLLPNWEHLTQTCGWSQKQYLKHITATARRLFVTGA